MAGYTYSSFLIFLGQSLGCSPGKLLGCNCSEWGKNICNTYKIKHFINIVFSLCNILFCLFVLRINVPVNKFSVMSGRSHRFLGFNQCSGELICLAQGHRLWGSNPGPLDSQSDTLPLRHRAPCNILYSLFICMQCNDKQEASGY